MNLLLAIGITCDFKLSRFSLTGFSSWSAKLGAIKSMQSTWISQKYAPIDWVYIYLWIFTCVIQMRCSWTSRCQNIKEIILVCIPKFLMTHKTMKWLHSTLLIPLQVRIKYSTLRKICQQVKIKYGFYYRMNVITDIKISWLSSRSPPPPQILMKLNVRIFFQLSLNISLKDLMGFNAASEKSTMGC